MERHALTKAWALRRHLLRRGAGLVQRRTQAEAVGARGRVGRQVLRRDAAHRQEQHVARKHRAQRLQRRPASAARPGTASAHRHRPPARRSLRWAWRCRARTHRPCALAARITGRIAVRHDDQPPAGLGHLRPPAPRSSPCPRRPGSVSPSSRASSSMLRSGCGEFSGTSMMRKPASASARPTGTASSGVMPRRMAIKRQLGQMFTHAASPQHSPACRAICHRPAAAAPSPAVCELRSNSVSARR